MEVAGGVSRFQQMKIASLTRSGPHGIGLQVAAFHAFEVGYFQSDIGEFLHVDGVIFRYDHVDLMAQ